MKRQRTARMLCACMALALLPAPGLGGSHRRELDMATLQLMDAAIRSDESGLAAARSRIERVVPAATAAGDPEAAASARYHLAFASWAGIWSGIGLDADPAATIRAALADLEAALAARPDFADAHMLAAMCHVALFRVGGADAATGPAIGTHARRAREIAPNDPRVGMFGGLLAAFDPNGPARPEGVKKLEEACAALERERRERPRLANWWDVTALLWLGMVNLASETPDVAAARGAVERALALRPDFAAARPLLGATDPRRFVAADALGAVRWTLLASDPEGDGKHPSRPDARALYVSAEPAGDRTWFRFETYGPVSSKSFGVNLVVDVDGDQTNGMAWWGGRTDFKFDRLVTVWVTSTDGARYRGYVGVADARAARAGQFNVIAQNDIEVAIDPEGRSVYIGIRRADLGTAPESVLLGAVGSSLLWNDDVIVPGMIHHR